MKMIYPENKTRRMLTGHQLALEYMRLLKSDLYSDYAHGLLLFDPPSRLYPPEDLLMSFDAFSEKYVRPEVEKEKKRVLTWN